jgi:6-phosphogluconolactonase (cycloisomerase 2 family)
VTPARIIQGGATQLNSPWGVTVDSNFIYVTNARGSAEASITVYPIGANGNTAPVRTIQGINTTLNYPRGISVDSNFIYVVNHNVGGLQDRVDVYPINADGNIAPVRTIEGANTGLSGVPYGIDVDGNYIYVSVVNSQSIRVFNLTDNGNVFPVRIIAGGNTNLETPLGLAVNTALIFSANSGGRISSFPLNGNGNILPSTNIEGANTNIYEPYEVAIDAFSIYVADIAPRLLVFPLAANGNVSPSQTIEGSNTGLLQPTGIAVDGRDLLMSIPSLTEWGMIIFLVLAGLEAVYYLRRQRRANS